VWNEGKGRMAGMTTQNPFDFVFKILLLGDSDAGKTSLLLRFTDDQFFESLATVGFDYKDKEEELDSTPLKLQLWDTGGQERFRTITASYFRGAHGVVMVYDVTNKYSYSNVKQWVQDIQRNCSDDVKIILVGNKQDLIEEGKAVISTADGEKLAADIQAKFMLVSAKTGYQVRDAFRSLLSDIVACHKLKETDFKTPGVITLEAAPSRKRDHCPC
jgi:Ras-related protein Rab-1A